MLEKHVSAIMAFLGEHGIKVIPGHPDGSDVNKAPLIKNPVKSASDREDVIRSWVNGGLVENAIRTYSMPCGAINGVVVIDCDRKDGPDGVAQFNEWCSRHNVPPSPVYQDTPHGGRHYFYRYDQRCATNRTDIKLEGSVKNIDIKTDGGLVRVDPFGTRYKMHGSIRNVPELPEELIAEIRSPDREPSSLSTENKAGEIPGYNELVEHLADVAELIESACQTIGEAEKGARNTILNKVAYYVGRELSIADPVDWENAKKRMIEAGEKTGLLSGECRSTVEDAFSKGVARGVMHDRSKLPYFIKRLKYVRDEIDDDPDVFKSLKQAPYNLLGNDCINVIESLSKGRQVPVEMVMAMMLMLPAMCVGNACSINYDRNWKEYANLFMLIVGESGVGKSLVKKFVFGPLLEKQGELKDAYMEARKQYEIDMAEWKRSKKSDKGERPEPPRNRHFILNDSTIEAAIELLKDNPRGLSWYVDEGRGHFTRMDRYTNNSGDGRSKMISAWDSQELAVTRKTHNGESNEIYNKRATFSILAGVQPSFVPEFFCKGDDEQGLLQRFLMIRAVETAPAEYPLKEIPEEIDAIMRRTTHKLLEIGDLGEIRNAVSGKDKKNEDDCLTDENGEEIFGSRELPTEFYLSPKAKKYFDEIMTKKSWYTFQTDKASFAKKSNSQTLRLALNIHLLRWATQKDAELSPEISYKTMASAVSMMNWFSANMERILKLMSKPENDDSMIINRAAAAILEHEEEIMECKRSFVPNKVWKQWIIDADITLSNRALKRIMNSLKSIEHAGSKGRGRIFNEECLKYCEKLSEKHKGFFPPEREWDEEDKMLKADAEAKKEEDRLITELTAERMRNPGIVPSIAHERYEARSEPPGSFLKRLRRVKEMVEAEKAKIAERKAAEREKPASEPAETKERNQVECAGTEKEGAPGCKTIQFPPPGKNNLTDKEHIPEKPDAVDREIVDNNRRRPEKGDRDHDADSS